MLFKMAARRRTSAVAPIAFVGNVAGNSAGETIGVHTDVLAGDLVTVYGGNSAAHVDVNFDAEFDLEDADNGGTVCMGCGYTSSVADNTHVFTASVSLARRHSHAFRNATSVQTATPTFATASTSMVFPGITIPPGGGRVLLMGYTTSTHGGATAPAGFTGVGGLGATSLIPAFLSDDVLTTFTGATATLVNSVIQAKITAVVLQ